MKKALCEQLRLYLITGPYNESHSSLAAAVEKAAASGITMVQLREKGRTKDEIVKLGKMFKIITDNAAIPLIINDDYQAALEIGAAGVHLGQKDGDIAFVRKRTGGNFIIGSSANTVEEAVAAAEAGADYIGAGALFTTETKSNTRPLSLEIFKEICHTVTIPVVGIGGIRKENISDVIKSGGCGIAVSSMILLSEHLEGTVKKSVEKIKLSI